jgi:chaperonin GroES
VSKRLTWAEVMAVGPHVRSVKQGDSVLFNPEDRYEVEVRGDDYVILRERDVHAVASKRLEEGSTGLYL